MKGSNDSIYNTSSVNKKKDKHSNGMNVVHWIEMRWNALSEFFLRYNTVHVYNTYEFDDTIHSSPRETQLCVVELLFISFTEWKR